MHSVPLTNGTGTEFKPRKIHGFTVDFKTSFLIYENSFGKKFYKSPS
jgi:hypothetical protein